MDVMTAVWSAATLLPSVSTGTGAAYQALFLALRRVILGRTLTMKVAGEPLTMTVTEVVSLLDPYQLISGRLDVRLTVTGINWGESDFGHANVVLRNVQLRRGTPPVVFAAPVEVALHVPGAHDRQSVARARPGMSADIDDDGVARLHWARRPGWGNVEVDIDVDDGSAVAAVRVKPRALIVAGRHWKLPTRRPSYRIALTRLPPDAELTGVRVETGNIAGGRGGAGVADAALSVSRSGIRSKVSGSGPRRPDVPRSRPEIAAISSPSRLKSNSSKFSFIRPGDTDFGNTMSPRWMCQRSTACAGDFPMCRSDIRDRRVVEDLTLGDR